MKPNRSLTNLGIALGWGLFVIVGVRLVDSGFGFWKKQRETLSQAQEQVKRLQGWLDVEKPLRERQGEVCGSLGRVSGTDLSWAAVQGLQKVAQEQGVSVTQLQPSRTSGQGPEVLHLDTRIEGRLEQVSGLVQRLPEFLPGIRLDSVQFVPQGGNRIQALLRLSLSLLEH